MIFFLGIIFLLLIVFFLDWLSSKNRNEINKKINLIIIFISFFLKYSKSGIILRAVGDDHQSAHSVGYPVKKIRWYATCFGGMCAGIGGAYIPLVLTPHWSEGMTAGRGWIALALVVFASWIPWRIIVGALIFGGITTKPNNNAY